MPVRLRSIVPWAAALALAGCGPDYSPNTYSTTAVQQASKVDQGVVVGVRTVAVAASGTTGAVTGAAAGGIAASQVPGNTVTQAFSALGGSVVGGLVGTAAEHAAADTTAYEYIVRKSNGDLLSVTQKDEVPLALGQKVLLIAGSQARIVPDYTVPSETAPEKAAEKPTEKPAEKAVEPPPPAAAPDPTRFVPPVQPSLPLTGVSTP